MDDSSFPSFRLSGCHALLRKRRWRLKVCDSPANSGASLFAGAECVLHCAWPMFSMYGGHVRERTLGSSGQGPVQVGAGLTRAARPAMGEPGAKWALPTLDSDPSPPVSPRKWSRRALAH